jgi:hypothetical protein
MPFERQLEPRTGRTGVLFVSATLSFGRAAGQQQQRQRLPQPEQIYRWNPLPVN